MECSACSKIDRYAFEAAMVTFEQTIKRLWIAIIILILLLAGTNAAWIYYESQWEVVETTEVTQEADGDSFNSFVGGNYYGSSADGQDDPTQDS